MRRSICLFWSYTSLSADAKYQSQMSMVRYLRASDAVRALLVLAIRTYVSVGEDRIAKVARPAHSLSWLLEDTLYGGPRAFTIEVVFRHVVELHTASTSKRF